jgi:hypothetical protein
VSVFFVYKSLITIQKQTIMEKKTYLAPVVEVLEVAVEQGFAASGIDDMPYGGNNW